MGDGRAARLGRLREQEVNGFAEATLALGPATRARRARCLRTGLLGLNPRPVAARSVTLGKSLNVSVSQAPLRGQMSHKNTHRWLPSGSDRSKCLAHSERLCLPLQQLDPGAQADASPSDTTLSGMLLCRATCAPSVHPQHPWPLQELMLLVRVQGRGLPCVFIHGTNVRGDF